MKEKFDLIGNALLLIACTVLLSAGPVMADTGPKPAVFITFNDLPEIPCYGTLLSEESTTGPASAWDGTAEGKQHYSDTGDEIGQKFVEYKDPDGFYYLQEDWKISEDEPLEWTYYAPATFKVLLYYPETDTFEASGIIKRETLQAHFTASAGDNDDEGLIVTRQIELTRHLPDAIRRLLLTLLIEMAVILLFRFRQMGELVFAFVMNVITQTALNAVLLAQDIYHFSFADIFVLIGTEVLIFAAEIITFSLFIRKRHAEEHPKWAPPVCMLVANTASLVIGLLLP